MNNVAFHFTVPGLPMHSGFHFQCSGTRSGEVWLDDASGCEDPGTIPSAFPAPHQSGKLQEMLGCRAQKEFFIKKQGSY